MAKKLTLEEVQRRIKEKNGDNIFIKDYYGLNKFVTVYCKSGKHNWQAKARNLIEYDTYCFNCKNYIENLETITTYLRYKYCMGMVETIINSFDYDVWTHALEQRNLHNPLQMIKEYVVLNNTPQTVESMAEDFINKYIEDTITAHNIQIETFLDEDEKYLYKYEQTGEHIYKVLAKGRNFDERKDGERFKDKQEKIKLLVRMSQYYEDHLDMKQ